MGLSFAPESRDLIISNSYCIDEVTAFLTRYLNDEFELTKQLSGKTKRKNRRKAKPQNINLFKELNDVQAFMLSAEIIGTRIILKYIKGEQPHWIRKRIWEKSLLIAKSFEERGLIIKKELRNYSQDGYLFCCGVYFVDGLGELLLPEEKPCLLSDISIPTVPYTTMPPLRAETGGTLKKEAAKLITEYGVEESY